MEQFCSFWCYKDISLYIYYIKIYLLDLKLSYKNNLITFYVTQLEHICSFSDIIPPNDCMFEFFYEIN